MSEVNTGSTETNELKRVMGVTGLAATIVNFTIGVGIYALPALIGIRLGAAAIIGYILCALLFTAIILCYVEIGSRIKTTGGSYAYVEAAFGPFAGFIVNGLFIFGWEILGDAAVMNIVGDSMSILFPVFLKPLVKAGLFFILITIMVILNVTSAKTTIRFVSVVTFLKILPLLAIIILGIGSVKATNLQWHHLPSLKALEDTAIILFFAFAGFETSLNASGEIKDPKRTIPRAVLLGGIVVIIIYLLIQTITQGILGAQMADYKDAPLAAVAQKLIGPAGAIVILVAATVSGAALVTGDVFACPRLIYAGAKDGTLPKFLGKVHPRFITPYWAIIVYGALVFIFSVSGGFKQLAILASAALLLIYLAVIMAMIKLRNEKAASDEKTFSVPGGLTIPVIAIIAIVWVLSNLSLDEFKSIGIFIASLCLIYFVMRKVKDASLVIPDK